jgi:CheY-like chemotaxis protein
MPSFWMACIFYFCSMANSGAAALQKNDALHVLLADDDADDRFFFEKVIREFPIPTMLTAVEDGEQLMNYLSKNRDTLPDLIFLDLNMPKKNGLECIEEIKQSEKLKNLPLIIYSTAMDINVVDLLFSTGVLYYIRKTEIVELRKALHYVLTLLAENKLNKPSREKFVLTQVKPRILKSS